MIIVIVLSSMLQGKGDMTTYWVKGRDPAFKVQNGNLTQTKVF